MAKKLRYPKKFRQKLEKIAEGREAREAEAKLSALQGSVFDTLYHTDIMPLLDNMAGVIVETSDDQRSLAASWTWRDRHRPDRVEDSPPWAPIEPIERPAS